MIDIYLIVHSLTAIAAFPTESHKYIEPLESKYKIYNNFKQKRGCYIWTHKESGSQYIGSSKNLSQRLADYFRKGYLNRQNERGSAIARAILKYGIDSFSLSIMVLGDSHYAGYANEDKINYSSTNLPDFVVMEQSYIDNYDMVYNVNRTATSVYVPSNTANNVGLNNPSHGLLGNRSFAWGNLHSKELKSKWSDQRGKYKTFIYSAKTFDLLQSFNSAIKLSAYLKRGKGFGAILFKTILTSNTPAIIYKDFIISLSTLDYDFLTNNFNSFPVKREVLTKKKIGLFHLWLQSYNKRLPDLVFKTKLFI